MKVTPVPIPNTTVKLHSADGTARETVWESRSSPGNSKNTKHMLGVFYLCKKVSNIPIPNRLAKLHSVDGTAGENSVRE